MTKRYRIPQAKEGELLVKYGKDDCGNLDLQYCWPENTCLMRRDTNLIMRAFNRFDVNDGNCLIGQLKARGYDITTLQFSIKKLNPELTNQ